MEFSVGTARARTYVETREGRVEPQRIPRFSVRRPLVPQIVDFLTKQAGRQVHLHTGVFRCDFWLVTNVRQCCLLDRVVLTAELSPRTFCTLSRESSSRRRDEAVVLEELSGVRERSMIIAMPTTARPQQRYDHRLRHLVQRTGDVTVATNHGVPRSTARGWLGAAPTVVVSLDVADLTEPQLRQEVLKLRRRVQKLAALLRLALALLRTSGFRLTGERLPDGRAKMRILRAVDRAREYLPLRTVLRFLRVSPSRFHAWRRRQRACALDDQSSCPRTSPYRLTPPEVRAIKDMVTSPEYRHVPTGTLAVLAQRLGKVWASPSTWYRLVRKYGWRRPRLRVHPAKPKVGLRTTRADEMWHIDTTVIRLLDGHPRLSPRRDRQLLTTDPGVASRRHVRTGQQRGRARSTPVEPRRPQTNPRRVTDRASRT